MAILKLGVLVTGIRGTVGGTIFSANKSGPFARNWSRGADPMSTSQTTVRARLSSHATEWQDLAQADRDDWDTYAADPAQELTNSLGEAYYGSGWNWYCRINNHLLVAGEARRDTYPTNARPAAPTITGIYVRTPITGEGDAFVTYPSNQFLGYLCVVFLAFAPSTALLWKSRGYLLTYIDKNIYTTFESFGWLAYDLFGDPILGSKIFATIQRQEPHGQRSAITTKTGTVSAS